MATAVEVKERPILFSGPMVRAILNGHKTQTRRVIKPQPLTWKHDERGFEFLRTDEHRPVFADTFARNYSPYGQSGDHLWVRETWAVGNIYDNTTPRDICDDIRSREGFPSTKAPCKVAYPASDGCIGLKGRPSIHMPRWASRITLQVTGVRIEQLQSISNADIAAEGIEPIGEENTIANGSHVTQCGRLDGRYSTMRQLWSELWAKINGQASWDANPWVWVVEFAKTEN
jgi:hypothetical protein